MDKKAIRERMRSASRGADAFWGIGVSAESSLKAAEAGAAWGLINHAVGMTRDIPSSAIGLLPFADANGAVLAENPAAVDPRLLPVAAVFANDQFRTRPSLLSELSVRGYRAVENFPSVGLPEGRFRDMLCEAHMVYGNEIEFIADAVAAGFFAIGLFFTPEQAALMAKAGADMLVFHPGLNADGEHREWNQSSKTRFLEAEGQARGVNPDIVMARSSFDADGGPPRTAEPGVGVQYDGWM
ncbi:MAG: phosphoenolpyruvate hydrolase family protein [Planctomycetota bacterium]|jgi:predicted TIM-barrel enzyme|nr:phosphoenolpyruvate hydrolase family protein [Planctomycetota bacterium]